MPALLPIRFPACCALLALAASLGCAQRPPTVDAPPPPMTEWLPRSSPPPTEQDGSLFGTYQGVRACHDCPATAMSVQLRADGIAVVRVRPLGAELSAAPVTETYRGPWSTQTLPHTTLITLRHSVAAPTAYRFIRTAEGLELRFPEALHLRKTSLTH